jgi:hypothetical protein
MRWKRRMPRSVPNTFAALVSSGIPLVASLVSTRQCEPARTAPLVDLLRPGRLLADAERFLG